MIGLTLLSLLQLLGALGEIYETEPDVTFVAARPGDIRHSLADISKARNVLDYDPKVSLKEGLEKLITS